MDFTFLVIGFFHRKILVTGTRSTLRILKSGKHYVINTLKRHIIFFKRKIILKPLHMDEVPPRILVFCRILPVEAAGIFLEVRYGLSHPPNKILHLRMRGSVVLEEFYVPLNGCMQEASD